MSRPSKLTPETQTQITRLIQVGNTVEVAAEAAGISRSTFFSWMERGAEAGPKNKPFRDFRTAVEQARAEAEATLVARIAKAAQNGSWSAAGWLLERSVPERWAKLSERAKHGDDHTEAPARPVDPLAGIDQLAEKRAERKS